MRARATLIGFTAILMWSLLALFTAASGAVPPFQLSAMCFLVATAIGAVPLLREPRRLSGLRQPLPVYALGIGGLFGYHFLYFTALKNAPPVDAGLIAYLWPLFIVVGSALLPGERLRWHHVAGAVMGLAGTVLIVARAGVTFEAHYAFGYAIAFLCALTWSSYSLVSRRFGTVPTDAVTAFCLATAVLALICHWFIETTVWPSGATQWLAVLCLGLGPVGGAFYVWDYGVKHGDIQVLGASSYAAPLLSTIVLVASGYGEASLRITIACVLISGGAALAARDMIGRRRRSRMPAGAAGREAGAQ
ncbi:aromatic amino acid exporter YddG [Pararhizobium mangrovi]|uniref:EamA family transporter n=1 Tax=Pararhizobium mangrovi TaxID=2590452 RepID=A0A506U439_9HYPH|nr:EamA family transporter [Pararhizobium mangrovi]TPW27309.1 EamA family transporter [Pararhizobium mangrovi]